MQPAEIVSRLDEWSRWARSNAWRRGTCGSIEGHYCSPQRNMWEAPVSSLQVAPIAWKAYQVELIVVNLPDPFRTALVLTYIRMLPAPVLRRDLRRRGFKSIGIVEVAEILAEARRRVAAGLERAAAPRSQVPSYPVLSATI